MASLTPNQVPTLFRDEAYKAFITELPTQADELDSQGWFDLFPERTINGISYYETQVFGSEVQDGGRNPSEPIQLGTMGQGYMYQTAVRSEHNESRTIADEYLSSVLKLGDFAAEQGAIMARNYYSSYARYFSYLLSFGGIVPSLLDDDGNGVAGIRPRSRIYAHYLKGEAGAIIGELTASDAADPDGKGWFTYIGNEHVRKNGDTTSNAFTGKTLGYFNAGGLGGGNLRLTADNLEQALLHMENNLPYGPDRVFYAAPLPDTLIVSGNLRSTAAQIIEINVYRQQTPNNDNNIMYKGTKVFKIQNIIVNRYLPDNCWYVCAKGTGVNLVKRKESPMSEGSEGPVKGSIVQVYYDMKAKVWARDFLCFWSHMFNADMDICWYAGSTPTAYASGRPTAPTAASLQDWAA